MTASESTCIYCGSAGPFSDEHVVPASIGGDDRNWLLKGCVCARCNTDVFSPLETKFSNSSPITIPRMAFQARTRNRGSHSRPPTSQPKESFIQDPRNLVVSEAVFVGGAGLVPVYLPQIHFIRVGEHEIETLPIGPNPEAMTSLLAELTRGLVDEIELVDKTSQAGRTAYIVYKMRWNTDRYQQISRRTETRAPRNGVWFASLDPVRQFITGGYRLTPRVFRHSSGSITCRAGNIDAAGIALGILRVALPRHTVRGDEQKNAFLPLIKQSYSFDMEAFIRVLAKIGLNVIAHTSGLETFRASNFDQARRFVLTGDDPLPFDLKSRQRFPVALEKLSSKRHLIGIRVSRILGAEEISAIFRLYGGPVHKVVLAPRSRRITAAQPVWLSVDYATHKIEQHS